MRILSALALAAFLAACGSGQTVILERPDAGAKYEQAYLVEGEHLADVSAEQVKEFHDYLDEFMFGEKGVFEKNENGFSVTYRFTSYSSGSRGKRYLSGGIGNWGEASAVIEVTFENPDGIQIGKINVEGRIGSGFFGGDAESTLKHAAREAAEYAVAHYR
ncbi:MAG: hypothetical protein PVF65_09095 [Sphingomonadales bacterium]|jgi:hypothetical protein